jgi:hypothetical protein
MPKEYGTYPQFHQLIQNLTIDSLCFVQVENLKLFFVFFQNWQNYGVYIEWLHITVSRSFLPNRIHLSKVQLITLGVVE